MEKSVKTEKLFRFIEIKEKLEKGEILKKKKLIYKNVLDLNDKKNYRRDLFELK